VNDINTKPKATMKNIQKTVSKLREEKAEIVISAATPHKLKKGTKNNPLPYRDNNVQLWWSQHVRLDNYKQTAARRTGEDVQPSKLRDSESYVGGCDSLVKNENTGNTRLQFETLGSKFDIKITIDGVEATAEQLDQIRELQTAKSSSGGFWSSVNVESVHGITLVD
tara:strand:- start:196 stop:696 length:501 start_codon:yes stop_codon:yes gene_type:complete